MPRPQKCRRICFTPQYDSFYPENSQTDDTLTLTLDEYEVIRLVDLEKKTHEQCSAQMDVSRTTVTEIYESARYKLAQCIVNGKRLIISGGNYRICEGREYPRCRQCMCHMATAEHSFPVFHLQHNKGEGIMKIAVTYENGEIFQHFGHTEQFKLYTIENGTITAVEVVDTNGSGRRHSDLRRHRRRCPERTRPGRHPAVRRRKRKRRRSRKCTVNRNPRL